MPKSISETSKSAALAAAVAAAPRATVGSFIETIDEGDNTTTFLFESKQKGYIGWRWSVTLFQSDDQTEPTISEVLLMPGPDSLVAPKWVPWSERLADYKALQAELEAQAALDAEDEDDETDIEAEVVEDMVEELEQVVDGSEASEASEESTSDDLAAANSEEGQDAQSDAEDTGKKKPRFLRRRKRFGKGKTKN
ncbi:DUF3027 domain-containing protein [Rhodoluna sp.]|uniref:DUF3027 domain-containing protein n=1 Tax=Rhodoluna sp. TaxID=1969481 RepID=UPI0025D90EA2|nr:DUF3027 domain-containing protein [Rhodoluna sp.]